jgi:putative nucleotidyltransferase with HDIG domain
MSEHASRRVREGNAGAGVNQVPYADFRGSSSVRRVRGPNVVTGPSMPAEPARGALNMPRRPRGETPSALTVRIRLARAVDAKDPSTRRHSERVADLSWAIAGILGWSVARRRLLHEAALVHDVGKIAIPDEILFKSAGLTPSEYETVKGHSLLGAEMLDGVMTPEQVGWVRSHHEWWGGGGYPDGLVGEQIPDGARIIAIADAWDAITSWRPYGAPRSPEEALAECRASAGTQFWPSAVIALARAVHAPGG